MPYIIRETTNPLQIKEQEFASAKEIKFTPFTSCIGVIAKKGAKLTAVHLVMVADDGSYFNRNAATTVLDNLPEEPDVVTIIGCIDLWVSPANGMSAAFEQLTGKLKTLKKEQLEDGTYGAKIKGDDIEITRG